MRPLVIATGLIGFATGCTQGAASSNAGSAGAASQPAVYAAFADHGWRLLDPANPQGPRMAVLWGDPAKGPYGALLRFPAGFKSPMHSHSLDEYTVTVQGVVLHWTEAESEATAKPMPPGSYTLIRGNVNHVSACAPNGPECIDFLTQSGPFDFKLAR